MTDQSYTTTITVEQSPDEAFDAINEPTQWWWEAIEGRADDVGAESVFDEPGEHCWHFRVTDLVRPERVVWRVLDGSSTDFVRDTSEWNGTEVRFEISSDASGATQIRFTHAGLVPEFECFEACSRGWSGYIHDSLHAYITTGQGQPGAY